MGRLPPKVVAMLCVTVLYRIGTGMGPLVILLELTEKLSLAAAALAVAGWTLAGAISQPLWTSVARRFGLRPTLVGLALVTFVSHAALGIVHGAAAAVAASTVAGAALPPIVAQARALLPRMVDGSRLVAVFEREAALASSAYVIAPLAVAITSFAGTLGPTLSCAVLLAAASLVFAQIGTGVEGNSSSEAEAKKNKIHSRANWQIIALIFSGAAEYAMMACLEVATIARVAERISTALIFSAWATTSFLGGLYLSRLRSADQIRLALLPVPTIACAAMAGLPTSKLTLFALALVLSGFALAPTMALRTTEIARLAPPSQHAKAYGWLQAGSWLGSAAATAVAGAIATNSLVLLLISAAGLAALSLLLILICLPKDRYRIRESEDH